MPTWSRRCTDSTAVKPAVPTVMAWRASEAGRQRHDPAGRDQRLLGEAAVVGHPQVVAVGQHRRAHRAGPGRRCAGTVPARSMPGHEGGAAGHPVPGWATMASL